MSTTPVVGQPLVVLMEYRLKGVLTDPTVVRCKYKPPTKAVQELAYPTNITKRAVGEYEVTVVPDEAGTWVFQGVGQGGIDAVNEVATYVAPSLVG